MSKYQQIMDSIGERLRSIKKANGYNSDLGNNVYEWRLSPFTTDKNLPAVTYRDMGDQDISIQTGLSSDFQTLVLSVDLDIAVSNGSNTISEVRKLREDVLKVIGIDETWEGLAHNTNYIQGDVYLDQNSEVVGGYLIKIEITYRTKAWGAN